MHDLSAYNSDLNDSKQEKAIDHKKNNQKWYCIINLCTEFYFWGDSMHQIMMLIVKNVQKCKRLVMILVAGTWIVSSL